ncbi:hypothetical protein EBT31_06140 [bacterium]|jgi:hypothetical protein|nr:hypothetical protein [bacterium]
MSDKQASSVLTSDNAAEFYAERLGLAEAEPQTEANAEPVEEPASEPEPEPEQSEPKEAEAAKPQEERKQNPKLEKRFSEITKQREEARAEAQREREARETLERRLKELEQRAAPTPVAPQPEQEPQPHQFQDAFEYAKALTDYRVEQRLAQEKAAEAQARAQAEQQKVINSWLQRVEAAKAELPDFDAMLASASDVPVPDHIRDAMLTSEVGPKLLYHFAENPDVIKRLSDMPPVRALAELGKLEARFEAKPEKPTVAKSKAPEPIQPIRANGKADLPITANGEFHGTYQAWKEARKAGKIR